MRIPHQIEDNKTSQYPRNFLFFDTETEDKWISDTEREHELTMGMAIYWRWRSNRKDTTKEYQLNDESDLFDVMEKYARGKSRLFVIAHNIQYDMMVLGGFRRMDERGWDLNKLIINNTTNICDFSKDGKKVVFLDNMNYFSVALASLGESVGLDKLDFPENTDDEETWIEYCRRDVEIMLEAWRKWLKFLKGNDMGTFAKTVASQAFNTYRHKYMQKNLYVHTNEEAVELERSGYHGGRTECFHIGEVPGDTFYSLDVNSMYPHVMKQFKYPRRLKYVTGEKDPSFIARRIGDYMMTATVEIETDQRKYPKRIDGRLCFPVGNFTTTLATEELRQALQEDAIQHVKKVAIYHGDDLFSDYVDELYQMRMEYEANDQHAFAFACKLLLNSLYGKFGQKNPVWEVIREDVDAPDEYMQEYNIDRQEWDIYRCINGTVEEKVGEEEGFHSMVAITGHVTANARLYLWQFVEEAGLDHVFYMDTDSIFVDEVGKQRLEEYIDPTELGALDVEKSGSYLNIKG